MKQYFLLSLLIAMCCNVLAQSVFVTFQDGKTAAQRSSFETINNLSPLVPLTIVSPKSLEAKGIEYLKTQTQLTRAFTAVFSDSLYKAYALPNATFTFLYFKENNSTPEHKFGIEKLKEMPELLTALRPLDCTRAQLYRFTECTNPYSANLNYYNSFFYVHYYFFYSWADLITKRSRCVSTSEQAYIYKQIYNDTTMYHYAKKYPDNGKFTPNIISIAANAKNVFYKYQIPLVKDTNEVSRQVVYNQEYRTYLFTAHNDSLKLLTGIDKFFKTNNSDLIFAIGDTLYFTDVNRETGQNIVYGFSVPKDTCQYLGEMYSYQTPQNSRMTASGYIASETLYLIYSDTCLFFTKGNSYFSLAKNKIITFDRQPDYNSIVAANKTNNIVKVIYRTNNIFELFIFKEIGDKCIYLNSMNLRINSAEMLSNIVFRTPNDISYLNNEGRLINIKLQK